jgi:hypothetical protein
MSKILMNILETIIVDDTVETDVLGCRDNFSCGIQETYQ